MEGPNYGGDTLNLLLDFHRLAVSHPGRVKLRWSLFFTPFCGSPFLITMKFPPDPTITLGKSPMLRKLKTRAPYNGMLAYIDDQTRIIRSVAPPFLGQIVFFGKWDESWMGRNIDWLEPAKWEMVDRELCNLMDRLDGEVGLEVVFADRVLSGGHGLKLLTRKVLGVQRFP